MERDPMLPDLKRMEPATLAAAVRQACIEAALAVYAEARLNGLCHEGAWECAVDAMRSLDLVQWWRGKGRVSLAKRLERELCPA